MIFLKKVFKSLNTYKSDACGVKDKASLYGICDPTPPLATHIVFAPMPGDIKQDLVSDYKRTFPTDLLTLYSAMNGANFFWSTYVVGRNTKIPFNYFSIYAVPLTHDRQHIEPFNIRIEDLNRPNNTPESWLKFGSYYRPENTTNRLDLFIDTDTSEVFAVEHDCAECCVFKMWHSLDSCLCSLWDMFWQDTRDKGTVCVNPIEK
ncbi:MAG: hypothetical protein IKD21_00340 [Clostridia bacterium]|nr:hypothetical protein [Clostridia bacterium]